MNENLEKRDRRAFRDSHSPSAASPGSPPGHLPSLSSGRLRVPTDETHLQGRSAGSSHSGWSVYATRSSTGGGRSRQGPEPAERRIRAARIPVAAGQQAVQFVSDEEAGVRGGATIMVQGTRVTGRSRLCQRGNDAGRWKVGYLPHADASGTAIIPAAWSRRRPKALPDGISSPASRPATRSWSGWPPTGFRR
jgi:hypothetical protein